VVTMRGNVGVDGSTRNIGNWNWKTEKMVRFDSDLGELTVADKIRDLAP